MSRLGEPALPFLGADFLATLPGLFSTDLEASTAALRTFIQLTTSSDRAPEDLYLALGYNLVVPPHVRQAMLSRTLTHDGLLEGLTTPVLVAHGSDDEIILPAMAEHHGGSSPTPRPPGTRHRPHPFLEAPAIQRRPADVRIQL